MTMTKADDALELVELSEDQKKKRRMRSLAIALFLGLMVVLFYGVTMVKISNNIGAGA